MRLDKYLKVARILKRRTVSKELAENQRVTINGKIAKPSTEVKIGDEIAVTFGQRVLTVRVLDIKEVVKKNEAGLLYEIIDEQIIPEDEMIH